MFKLDSKNGNEQNLKTDAQRRDPGRGRLRRRLSLLAIGLAMVVGLPLAGGGAANAMTIQNGDMAVYYISGIPVTYLDWIWAPSWNGYQWVWEPLTRWPLAYGGGTIYCWAWSGGCDYSQLEWRQY